VTAAVTVVTNAGSECCTDRLHCAETIGRAAIGRSYPCRVNLAAARAPAIRQ